MKRIFLISILLITSFCSFAQPLNGNTYFRNNNSNDVYEFRNDTLFLGGFLAYSTFTEINGVFSITDFLGVCRGSYTASYNIRYASDTVFFTLITDTCSSRTNIYTLFPFVKQQTTSTNDWQKKLDLTRFYPNPTNGSLQIDNLLTEEVESIQVFSMDGKLIDNVVVSQSSLSYPFDVPKGLYFFKLNGRTGEQRIVKVIKN